MVGKVGGHAGGHEEIVPQLRSHPGRHQLVAGRRTGGCHQLDHRIQVLGGRFHFLLAGKTDPAGLHVIGLVQQGFGHPQIDGAQLPVAEFVLAMLDDVAQFGLVAALVLLRGAEQGRRNIASPHGDRVHDGLGMLLEQAFHLLLELSPVEGRIFRNVLLDRVGQLSDLSDHLL